MERSGLLKNEDKSWMPSQFVSLMISSHYIVLLALRRCTSGEEHSHLPCSNPIPFILMAFTADREDFCSHIPSLPWIFFFFCSWQCSQSITEKVMGKKEQDFEVQMAPSEEFCWVNSRFCCDARSSKCISGYQTKAAENSQFEILTMLELLCVPKASPWYPAKSQLIMRSPSQIAWPWELVKSGFTDMKSFPPVWTLGRYSLPDQRIWMLPCSHKIGSWVIYYCEDAIQLFISAPRGENSAYVTTSVIHLVPEMVG